MPEQLAMGLVLEEQGEDSPPEIPEHVNWSETNSRRILYNLYCYRLHGWIAVSPTIERITGTKHTQRNSDIRKHVLAGSEWTIQNRMRSTEGPDGERVIYSWYRLTTKYRARTEPLWPEGEA